jgi:AcrR family transcriptional regulator
VGKSVDPRLIRSREAILTAAKELLRKHGPPAVTHQRVAAQAGVGRATVYRHWPQPEQLRLEAMAGLGLPFFRDPIVPVRPWLHGQLRYYADEMAMPEVVSVALILFQRAKDPAVAEAGRQFRSATTDRVRTALDLAITHGELTLTIPREDAAARLVGPILYQAWIQIDVVTDDLIGRLIDGIGTWS